MTETRTGRTTSMLNTALLTKASNGGTAIRVFVHSDPMVQHCRRLAPLIRRHEFIVAQKHAIIPAMRGMTRRQVFVDHAVWTSADLEAVRLLDKELSRLI